MVTENSQKMLSPLGIRWHQQCHPQTSKSDGFLEMTGHPFSKPVSWQATCSCCDFQHNFPKQAKAKIWMILKTLNEMGQQRGQIL